MLHLIPLTVIFANPLPQTARVASLSGPSLALPSLSYCPCNFNMKPGAAWTFNEPDCGLVQTNFVFKRVKLRRGRNQDSALESGLTLKPPVGHKLRHYVQIMSGIINIRIK